MTQDEFKLLLKLKNGRIPHLEGEIFLSPSLSRLYLSTLLEYHDPNNGLYLAEMIHYYAQNRMQERWPAAERLLRTDVRLAYYYAYTVIKGRFHAAEISIAENPHIAYLYAKNVINGRFHRGEKAILGSEYKDDYKEYLKSLRETSIIGV